MRAWEGLRIPTNVRHTRTSAFRLSIDSFPSHIIFSSVSLHGTSSKSFSTTRIAQPQSIMTSAPPSSNARGMHPVTRDYDTSHSTGVRKYLRTYGLTPPNVESYETQASRCLKQLAEKTTSIDKYLYLSNLRSTNVHLFYRLVVDHVTDLTPLIYTPVVGEACLRWSEIYQQPEGLYISYSDRGHIASVLHNWPQTNVEITVVTDGSRILGYVVSLILTRHRD